MYGVKWLVSYPVAIIAVWWINEIHIYVCMYVYAAHRHKRYILQGSTNFSKYRSHLQCQKGNTKQVPCRGPAFLGWSKNLAFICCFFSWWMWNDNTFLYIRKTCSKYAENIKWHHTKFSCLDNQAAWVCAPLIYYVLGELQCFTYSWHSFDFVVNSGTLDEIVT